MTPEHVQRASVLIVIPTLGDRLELLGRTLTSIRSSDPCKATERTRIVIVTPRDAVAKLSGLADLHNAAVTAERPGVRGLAAAVNQAWRDADETVLTWIGDDDLLHTGFFDASDGLAANSHASGFYGRFRLIDESDGVMRTLRPGRIGFLLSRIGPNLLGQPGSGYRREALRSVGWLREDLPHSMDIDLFLRLDKWGTGLEYHPQVLGSFRWHTLSQTVRTPGATETEANTTREAHLPSWVIPPLRRGLRYAGRQLALLYYRWQRLLDGLKVCQS